MKSPRLSMSSMFFDICELSVISKLLLTYGLLVFSRIETEFDIVEPGEPKPPPLIPRDRRKAKKVNVVILDKREPLRPFGK